jgi:predicted Zn-dependent protease
VIRILLALVALMVFLPEASRPAEADHETGPYWTHRQVLLLDATTPEWEPVVSAAVAAWNQSEAINFVKQDVPECSYNYGAASLCLTYEPYSHVAYTTWGQYGFGFHAEFAYAVSVVNALYIQPLDWLAQVAVCHELGHALGLDHYKSNDWSCMNGVSSWPSQHDFDQLGAIYGSP